MHYLIALLLTSTIAIPPSTPRGTIQNDADPWFIQMNDGSRYGCMYGHGYKEFIEGELVRLAPGPKNLNFLISFANDDIALVRCTKF